MNSKILGLLVAGLLAGPMAANAAFIVDPENNTADKLIGTFSFTGTSDGFVDNEDLLLPQDLPDEQGNLNPGCNQLIGARTWAISDGTPVRLAFLFTGCLGSPDHPGFGPVDENDLTPPPLALIEGEQDFDPVSGSYSNSGDESPVYWSFTGLRDTGGVAGTFSGAFCFSTSEIECAVGAAPEPGTLILLSFGLAGIAVSRRRKR